MASAVLPSLVDGTYVTLEERRRKAAEAVKSLKDQALAFQTYNNDVNLALREQRRQVAESKELLAALAYLASALQQEVPKASTFVKGAQLLTTAYPETPFFQREAALLLQGMRKCASQQQELADGCPHDVAVITNQLAEAQRGLLDLELEAKQAEKKLLDLQIELRAARSSYALMLQPKQWSRYKWVT